jgi:hypothetical protein
LSNIVVKFFFVKLFFLGCSWGISTNRMPILANVLFFKMHHNFSHNTCYLLDTCWVSHERKLVQVFTFMKA